MQINQARAVMATECAARLDAKAVAPQDLLSLADLYSVAGQPDQAKVTVERALALKSLASGDRAGLLVYGVRTGLKEPKSEERNARLEKYVTELDALSAATIDQKLDAHVQMNGWYR